MPFVLAASIIGASKLKRSPDPISLAAVAAIACIAFAGPVFRISVSDIPYLLGPDPMRATKSHALGLIPAGAPVSTSRKIGGVLSERRFVYIFPMRRKATWVLLDARDPSALDRKRYLRNIAAINANPAWRLVYRSNGIEVLRKASRRVSSSCRPTPRVPRERRTPPRQLPAARG